MKVLITGGFGVVGSFFAKRMLNEGHQVHVIDSCEQSRNEWLRDQLVLHPSAAQNLSYTIVRMEQMDLSNATEADLILHAAAHTGIPHSAESPGDDWASNVDATRVLLDALRVAKASVPTVVLSSVKPYRVQDIPAVEQGKRYVPREPFLGVNEDFPLEPDEPYAASKMAQSALCMAYARSYNLPIVTLRCSNLYGPAPCHGPRHGWLTWFCISAALGIPIEIQGTGLQVRDMLHASDVADAVITSATHMSAVQGNVYNIGGGYANSTSVLEAATEIGKLTPIEVRHGPGRPHEDPIFVTDYRRFERETGWRPRVSLRDGIQEVLSWAFANSEALKKIYECG